MKITAVKIYNIRSFLDHDNYLTLEDNKTAIIGVNESGKSNVLEAIGKLNFMSALDNSYNQIKNLSVTDAEVEMRIELSMKESDMQKLGVSVDEEKTLLIFKVGKLTTISGTLSLAILQNSIIKEAMEFWEKHTVGELYNLTNDNRTQYNNVVKLIKDCGNKIIPLNQLDILNKNFKQDVNSAEVVECIKNLKGELLKIYSLFPLIMYKQWNGVVPVKAQYINTDAVKDLADVSSSLYKLTKAAGIEIDDMKQAFELQEGNVRKTKRYIIEQKIKKCICDEFKKFYQKSELELIIEFEANKLKVDVLTGNMVMSINERSNGLRWYLGLFIELTAMDYKNRDVLYLLDEPGVFLHVNAQKELLSLFDELCETNGQLVYTTHLPYMLDTENIYSIRSVQKDEDGQSHIYNRVYSGGLKLPSRQETLTPLIQAMGCDMKHSTDISSKRNIITEGITDRMYLEAGIKALNVSEQVNIIPSNGAASIPNIVSIMCGWGCDYWIVLDYDPQGFTQYKKMIKGFGEEIKDKIVFVIDGPVPEDINDKKIAKKTVENILSASLMSKLDTPYDGSEETKKIAAVEFRSKVFNGELSLDDETRDNFKKLFERLGISIS